MKTVYLTESQCFNLIAALTKCGRFSELTEKDLKNLLKTEFDSGPFAIVLEYKTVPGNSPVPSYFWSFYVEQGYSNLIIDETFLYGNLTQQEFDVVHGFCKLL